MTENTRDAKLALVLGSSRGVGKAIADSLRDTGLQVPVISSKEVDTADLASVEAFAKKYPACDVLVLNTGGPPKKDFFDITVEDWERYHTQLFVGFNVLLQRIKVNRGGYIFLVSSHHIKEPSASMVLSQSYRLASWSVLKALTKHFAKQDISCINIPLGPVLTDRLKSLNPDLKKLEDKLPLGRVGSPDEVGKLVRSIVEHDIKYLTGVSITLDGGLSSSL